MPIYEHRCKKCKHQFEVMIPMSQLNMHQPCPQCDSQQTVRLISRSSFALKGGGWAKDGYGSSTGSGSEG